MKHSLTAAILFLPIVSAIAQQPAQASADAGKSHVVIAVPTDIAWGPAPAILPAGARAAVVEGDPGKPGPFTLRLALPANYRIPPHWHPVPEHVTVMSGSFYVGMGETFDASKATELPTGTFAALGPGMRHFALTKAAAIIQLHGVGPWSLVYVNPADDPSKKPK